MNSAEQIDTNKPRPNYAPFSFHGKSPKKQKSCLTEISSQSLNSVPSIFIIQKTAENSKMSLMPGITSPSLGAFIGGLFYDSVFCTASCIPRIASYIAGTGARFRRSIDFTLIYNGGRMTAYAVDIESMR
jgi:hypothetical protein